MIYLTLTGVVENLSWGDRHAGASFERGWGAVAPKEKEKKIEKKKKERKKRKKERKKEGNYE